MDELHNEAPNGHEPLKYSLRAAEERDREFVTEMTRLASTLEGRPLPAAADVVSLMPRSLDVALIAVGENDRSLGAGWWLIHEPPLLLDESGEPLPEIALAVVEDARGEGVGEALIESLADRAKGEFDALTLNVHLLNPAVRLYMRTGFSVAGAGRGRFGVAMIRPLEADSAQA